MISRQLLRYALVGLTSNAIAYLAYLGLTALGAAPVLSMTAVYLVAASVGFVGHRQVTFGHSGSLTSAGGRYVIAHVCGYLLNAGLLIVFSDRLGYAHQGVQAVAIFIVAGFLFTVFRVFVFADSEPAPAPIATDRRTG